MSSDDHSNVLTMHGLLNFSSVYGWDSLREADEAKRKDTNDFIQQTSSSYFKRWKAMYDIQSRRHEEV